MNDRLKKYLNGIFSPYEDLHGVKELKEELLNDLREKMGDFKDQGYDDEEAYLQASKTASWKTPILAVRIYPVNVLII